MIPVIVAQRGSIKPAARRSLEHAGYIVLVVDNVDEVKFFAGKQVATAPSNDDEGFNLDGQTAR